MKSSAISPNVPILTISCDISCLILAGHDPPDLSKMMRFDDFTNEDVGNIIMDRIEPSTHRHYYRSSRENAVHDSTAHLSSSPSNSHNTTAGNQDSSALFTSASRLPAPTYRRQPQTRKHLRNHNRFRLPTRHFQHRLGKNLLFKLLVDSNSKHHQLL